MILFERTALIAPGVLGEAVKFAHEISALVKSITGIGVTVCMPVGGNPNRIGWRAEYDSLADYEKATSALIADQSYMEKVSKGAKYFIAGSANDEIWRSM